MVIGISISSEPKLEAIVITENLKSYSNLPTDSMHTTGEFSAENYHSIVFGSGNEKIIYSVIKDSNKFKVSTLENYVDSIHSSHKSRQDTQNQSYLVPQISNLNKEANLILSRIQLDTPMETAKGLLEQKEQFIDHQRVELQEDYNKFQDENSTSFVVVAFDKVKGKIRQWYFDQDNNYELFVDYIKIGSHTGSNDYLSASLQGLGLSTKFNTRAEFETSKTWISNPAYSII